MVEKMNRNYSICGDSFIFDNKQFNWVKEFEKYYPEIQQEFQSMLDTQKYIPSMSELSGGKNILTNKDNLRVCTLILYGERVINDTNSFINTYKDLDKIPEIKTAFFPYFHQQ
jgi:aspartyl/asparaginyl beta-hydroxylase (cupin superfamily)